MCIRDRCNDGDLVLLPDPCYPVFMTGSRLGGAEPWYYKLTKENHFLPDVSAIPEDVARKAKFMLVSLPANPVGSVGTPELYAEIVAFCRKYDILLVHDNAYSDIIFDGAHGLSLIHICSQTTARAASSTTIAPSSRIASSIMWRGSMLYIVSSTSAMAALQNRAQAFSLSLIHIYGCRCRWASAPPTPLTRWRKSVRLI